MECMTSASLQVGVYWPYLVQLSQLQYETPRDLQISRTMKVGIRDSIAQGGNSSSFIPNYQGYLEVFISV